MGKKFEQASFKPRVRFRNMEAISYQSSVNGTSPESILFQSHGVVLLHYI